MLDNLPKLYLWYSHPTVPRSYASVKKEAKTTLMVPLIQQILKFCCVLGVFTSLTNHKDMYSTKSLPGQSDDGYLDQVESAFSDCSKLEQSCGILTELESNKDLFLDAPLSFEAEAVRGKSMKSQEEQKTGREYLSIDYPEIETHQYDFSGIQNILPREDHDGIVRERTYGSVENLMQTDSEASQNLRGISRRSLHFGEAQYKTTTNSPSSSNSLNNINASSEYHPHAELESPDSSHLDSNKIACNNKHLSSLSKSTSTIPPRYFGNFAITIPKSPGVGLHLNNVPVGHSATVKMKLADSNISRPERSSTNIFGHATQKVCDTTEESWFESENSNAASFNTFGTIHPMKPMSISHRMEQFPCPQLSVMEVNVEHAVGLAGIKRPSPTRKRKNSSSTLDGDGCKRCNCKKTKCLKLYCDCFAAGIYCADSCSCQMCFNKAEYEETVLETRQQIESRNPLAFAPKIQKDDPKFPSNNTENGNMSTPSSARHKKGCNCKKSLCLKKYCECFQANVGCSSGCRCEGCKNLYGTKDNGLTGEMTMSMSRKERKADSFDETVATTTTTTNQYFSQAELYNSQNLSPLPPSLHSSEQGKLLPSMQSSCGRFLEAPTYATPIRSWDGREAGYNNSEMVDEFSPLPNPGSMIISSTVSVRDWSNNRYSSGGSLQWRSSGTTPTTQLDRQKFDILEDNTPEILKDICTPSKPLKAMSPNSKRISPPRLGVGTLGSNSAGGLVSGRKYTLKAVHFPSPASCTTTDLKRTNQQ